MVWREKGSDRSEVEKCRGRLFQYCSGTGLDLGCGGEKIREDAIGVDKIRTEVTDVVSSVRCLYWADDEVYDYVFSSHCLEDMEDTEGTLREWMRVIKPGGHLVLYMPNKRFYPNIGMPGANCDHVHDFEPADVVRVLRRVCPYEAVHVECHGEEDEYSFDLVAKKL